MYLMILRVSMCQIGQYYPSDRLKDIQYFILSSPQVAWAHYSAHGSAVLAVGTHVLTVNPRITVQVERDTWILVIGNVSIDDGGNYMCQISTVPPEKQYGYLIVKGKNLTHDFIY